MTAQHQETGTIPAIPPRLQPDDGNTEQKLRSNPIAVDADGNIDMDVALKYETDVDALIKKLEAKTPDGSKPVIREHKRRNTGAFQLP